MYCTGGIRCEKASLEMKEMGYQSVFQLEGGILKYIEEFPNEEFEGECFVFDARCAVDQDLKPSQNYKLCWACGQPGKEKIVCSYCSQEGILCLKCIEENGESACSKNCRYHAGYGRKLKSGKKL